MKTEAVNILVKLLTNVVNHPGELKYRQVRLGNKTIEEKLLPASGAFEVLFSCGFEESDDKLVLPLNAPDQILRDFLQALQTLDASSPSVAASTTVPPVDGWVPCMGHGWPLVDLGHFGGRPGPFCDMCP